ncbi:MAG: phage portal protein [Vicinamibacterales bacterium]
MTRAEKQAARAVAQAKADVARMLSALAGSYSAAVRTRLSGRTTPSGGSADTHLDPVTRQRLSRTCGDLARNSAVAMTFVERLCDFCVGDGPRVQSTAVTELPGSVDRQPTEADIAWRKKAQTLFALWWTDEADARKLRSGTQLLHDVVKTISYHGDGCFVKHKRQGAENPATGKPRSVLSISLVEGERIVSPKSDPRTREDGQPSLVEGVEMDEWGAPVAYHIAQWQRLSVGPTVKTKRIDVADCIYFANPRAHAVNLTRGEPLLQAVVDDLERLEDYMDSVAIAARVATLLALIVKTDTPAQTQSVLAEQAIAQSGVTPGSDGAPELALGPGSVLPIPTNASVETLEPSQPHTNHAEFVKLQLAMIGARLGLPYILGYLDFSAVNFHSGKSAIAVFYLLIDFLRGWISDRILVPIYRWWVRSMIDAGELEDHPEWWRAEVLYPPRPIVDLEKEAKAYRAAVDANLMPLEDAIAAVCGMDLDELLAKRERETKAEAQRGVTPAGVPGSVPGSTTRGTEAQSGTDGDPGETGTDPDETDTAADGTTQGQSGTARRAA